MVAQLRELIQRYRVVVIVTLAVAVLGGTFLALTADGQDDSKTSTGGDQTQGCHEPKQIDDPTKAVTEADARLEASPADADAYFTKGIALYQLQQIEQAAQAFQSATVLDQTCAPYFRALGQTLSDIGTLEPAKAALDHAIELDDADPASYLARGIVLGRLEDLEGALADFDKLLELEKDNAAGHFNRGIALSGLERYEDAIAAFDKAIEIDPKSADAHLRKAAALDALGRADEAAAERAKAEALGADPNGSTTTTLVGPVPGTTPPTTPTTAAPGTDLASLLLTSDAIDKAAGAQGPVAASPADAIPKLCSGTDTTSNTSAGERAGKFGETVRAYADPAAADKVFVAVSAEAKVGCLWKADDGSGIQLTALFAVEAPGGTAVGFSVNVLSSGGTSTTRTGAVIRVGGRLAMVTLDVELSDAIKPVRALAAAAAAKLAA